MSFMVHNIDIEAFSSELDVIHLLYHRNRNQHRRSIWWKHFSMLKRRSNLVVQLIRESQPELIIENHVKFILHKLIPRAYYLFHGILTQGQYVTLGLALIAILGRLFTILNQSFLEREAQVKDFKGSQCVDLVDGASNGENIGESVSRHKLTMSVRDRANDENSSLKREKEPNMKGNGDNIKRKKKNKNKKVNDIDAIFGF